MPLPPPEFHAKARDPEGIPAAYRVFSQDDILPLVASNIPNLPDLQRFSLACRKFQENAHYSPAGKPLELWEMQEAELWASRSTLVNSVTELSFLGLSDKKWAELLEYISRRRVISGTGNADFRMPRQLTGDAVQRLIEQYEKVKHFSFTGLSLMNGILAVTSANSK